MTQDGVEMVVKPDVPRKSQISDLRISQDIDNMSGANSRGKHCLDLIEWERERGQKGACQAAGGGRPLQRDARTFIAEGFG